MNDTIRPLGCLVCLAMTLGLLISDAQARPFKVRECLEVEVFPEHPNELETARQVGRMLCPEVKKLARLFRLKGRQGVKVLIAKDMLSWREQTGAGSGVSAVFHSGRKMIITRPAADLRGFGEHLKVTLVHETVHLMVDRAMGSRACPRWLNEGLAQWFSGARAEAELPGTEYLLRELENRMSSKGTSGEQRLADYRTSLYLVARLVDRIGEVHLIRDLKRLRKVKNPLDAPFKGRKLRAWLFDGFLAPKGKPDPKAKAPVPKKGAEKTAGTAPARAKDPKSQGLKGKGLSGKGLKGKGLKGKRK